MPFPFRTTAAILAVCAAAVSACSESPFAPDQELAVTTAGPVRFYAGKPSTITVAVTNNSASRTYQIADMHCVDPFTVTTAAGVTLPIRDRPCTAIGLMPTALPPGQSRTLTTEWRGDAAYSKNGSTGPLLSPGTYVVRGFVHVMGRDSATTVASSAPLTTEILAP